MIGANRNFVIYVLVAALLSPGCGKRNREIQEDPVLKAYRLIDEQRTDEAIELLESELARDPGQTEYKVVLASAYAHKAGLRIQSLVPVVTQMDSLKKIGKPEKIDSSAPYTQQTDSIAGSVASILSQISGFLSAYRTIPTLDRVNVNFIRHAIKLLNEVGEKIQPADVLYRAVLSIVLFKFVFADSLYGEVAPRAAKDPGSCDLNVTQMNDAIVELSRILIDVYNDLGRALPKQADEMRRRAEGTASTAARLTVVSTSAIVLDEASNIFLKKTFIQSGFGKVLKCGGRN